MSARARPNSARFDAHAIEPGPLTDADKSTIAALTARGWGKRRIGRVLQKHPSAIAWYCYTNGLARRSPAPRRDSFWRGGVLVRPFSDGEDAFIEAARVEGLDFPAIAAAHRARFGFARQPRQIRNRLIMLASFETAAEDEVPVVRGPERAGAEGRSA